MGHIYNFDLEHLTSAIATAVNTLLSGKQDSLQYDSAPTQNSTKHLTSGAVYTALNNAGIEGEMTTSQINTLVQEALTALNS